MARLSVWSNSSGARVALAAVAQRIGQARIALAAGLAAVAVAIVLVLSSSPPAVVRSPVPLAAASIFDRTTTGVPLKICQADEVLPRAATAVRVWLEAVIGPAVEAQVLSSGRVIARGARGAGWTSGSVTIPIRPAPTASLPVTVCFYVRRGREPIELQGVHTARAFAAFDRQGPFPPGHGAAYRQGPLPGRLMIEYLRPGSSSWWSLATSVAKRMGLGRAPAGTWVALLAVALMLAIVALTSRVLLRELA